MFNHCCALARKSRNCHFTRGARTLPRDRLNPYAGFVPPPVVLHHGLFGFGDFELGKLKVRYFAGGIDRAIGDRGHPVIISRVHPTGGIARRAAELKETILRQLKSIDREKERVIIFAHSMGGLDARYMISKLGMDDRVQTLVTICTPHRGSPYANWCVEHIGQRLGGFQLMNMLEFDVQAISDLTIEKCSRFNDEVTNAPAVKYFSVAGSRPLHRVPAFLMHSFQVIHDAEGPNDGLVSVKSAQWGEHLGTWPADHMHAINKRLVLEIKEPTGDITPYYMKLLDRVLKS